VTNTRWVERVVRTALLKHSLIRCVGAARLVGGSAVLVTALDENAAALWKRRGSIHSNDNPPVLFRSMADAAASVAADPLWQSERAVDSSGSLRSKIVVEI